MGLVGLSWVWVVVGSGGFCGGCCGGWYWGEAGLRWWLAVASVGCGLCRGLRKMERVGERDRGRVRNNNKKSNKNIKERIFK